MLINEGVGGVVDIWGGNAKESPDFRFPEVGISAKGVYMLKT